MNPLAEPTAKPTQGHDDGDELVHLTCRQHPNRAYCGTDLSTAQMWHPGVQVPDCIVCHDLRDTALATGVGCPNCTQGETA